MESTPRFKLVVLQGPNLEEEFEITEPSVVIGRSGAQGADIGVDSALVSRLHARISQEGGRWTLQDLGSKNGTFLNGNRLSGEPAPLNPDDKIQLGPAITLVFRSADSAPAPPLTRAGVPESPATVIGEDFDLPVVTTPPQLTVIEIGEATQIYTLTEETYNLGRSGDSDIVLHSQFVSRNHARLERSDGGYQFVSFPEALNPVHLEGRPLSGTHRLRNNDVLRIGDASQPGSMVTLIYYSPDEATLAREATTVEFGAKSLLQIGRDASNDVVIDAPTVSRFHAQIERIGQRYRLRDLRSSNGTFVNDARIQGDVWLQPDDAIRIGSHRFILGPDRLDQYDETGSMGIEAVGLNKWVRKDLNILQNISAVFQPREFIVIVGQSGGGKSTLLDAMSGYRPATHGTVIVNDVDVYKNFEAIRNNIGYVPQRDIIHFELTAYEALDYAAQLRMPPDTTPQERHQRVMEVLADLDLTHRKDVRVSGLSGGQQKRVSIGVELLTKPGLFFLDEPTSGLDPGTETSLMQLMRRLADQGRTIVLVTHATKNVMLADKVLFMARGGHLAWFGPPDEALQFFDQYRSERDRRARDMEFDQIYALLEDPANGSPADWAQRFQQHPAYQQHIVEPLYGKPRQMAPQAQPEAPQRSAPRSQPRVSALRQFLILSARNLKILTRDRVSLILMLSAAPLVSMLDVLIAFMVGRNVFDSNEGSVEDLLMSFFLLIIFAAFVGGLSQMREIVKEQEIYKRERLVNLQIVPYVSSKVWIAGLLALYHAIAYIGIHYLAYEMPGGVLEFVLMYITMALLAMAGMVLGLFASALAPSPNTAPMLVILLIMPQIVLSSALVPLPGVVSAPAATRWAFEAFMSISGVGSDVAADACWALPDELQSEMDLNARTERCNCMGLNALKEETCNFPGIGSFYNEVIEEPKPEEPPPLRDSPAEPQIPPAPEQPADTSDQIAMAEYFEALQDYQDEAASIQDAFEAEMRVFEVEAELFQKEMETYQTELFEWEIARSAAVEPAESVIRKINQDFGWTFVDKSDSFAFWSKIVTTWIAQTVIISVLILGVLLLVKRKDVV